MKMDHRQTRAYDALRELKGLREIRGEQHHPWILKAWEIAGAPWYDTDEDAWCGATAARVLKEAGLPIPEGGMGVQARAWHEKGWGQRVPLEDAPEGALIVLRHHVGFLHSLVREDHDIIGIRIWGGNQSNGINLKTYPYIDKGRLQFLSARVWPAEAPAQGVSRTYARGFMAALWRAPWRWLKRKLTGGKA